MKIISRDEAKRLGYRYYTTGKPCKHGHLEPRLVRNHMCTACLRLQKTGSRAANEVRRAEYRAAQRNAPTAAPESDLARRRNAVIDAALREYIPS